MSASCAGCLGSGGSTPWVKKNRPGSDRYLEPFFEFREFMRRTAPLLIAASILLAAVPAAADGAVRHVLRGAGFGHGIGMSQYGAYGCALEGARFP